jgi:hypothetical protein
VQPFLPPTFREVGIRIFMKQNDKTTPDRRSLMELSQTIHVTHEQTEAKEREEDTSSLLGGERREQVLFFGNRLEIIR